MVLDMNIKLEGIDEEFLEDLDELIEDTRVEYFIINPKTKDELEKTKKICEDCERFKYVLPIEFKENIDSNCVAINISDVSQLALSDPFPLVIESACLSDSFIEELNKNGKKGVILDAKELDTKLENFAFSLSQDSIKHWTQKGIMDFDYNKLALQSDYPNQSYDDFLDVMLKEISDLTFRAEQTIAAGGTRTVLKTFKLL